MKSIWRSLKNGCALTWLVIGVSLTSPVIAQITPNSILPAAPERIAKDQNNVEVTNGSINISQTELSIGPSDTGLVLTRFYSSDSGWRDSFNGLLHVVGNLPAGYSTTTPTRTASWGNQSWSFTRVSGSDMSGTGATIAPHGSGSNDEDRVLTTRDGTVIDYSLQIPGTECQDQPCDEYFVPTTVTYPNGLVLTLHYTPLTLGARLQSVTNSAGYQVKFTYMSGTFSDPSLGTPLTRTGAVAINNAVEYCDPNADTCSLTNDWPSVSYTNTSASDGSWAVTVTDALNHTTRYTRTVVSATPTSNISHFSIKTPGNTTDNIQYTVEWLRDPLLSSHDFIYRVTDATFGSRNWHYAYSDDGTNRFIDVTDPSNATTRYTTTGVNGIGPTLASVENPLGKKITFSSPCIATVSGYSYANLGEYNVSLPDGNKVERTCDQFGNITSVTLVPKTGSDLLTNIVTAATFTTSGACGKACNKPTATTDGNNFQTDYTYYPTHGGIETQTLPADATGVRQKKVYGYDQYHGYVRNAANNLVQVGDNVYLMKRGSECRETGHCHDVTDPPSTSADEVVTTYQYGSTNSINALAALGVTVTSEGLSLRTCYSYDWIGNRISVTAPRANLSTCPDGAQWGAAAFRTGYRYDDMRRLTGVISPTAGNGYEAARTSYDEEGRVVTVEHGSLAQWPGQTSPSGWTGFSVNDVTTRTYDSMGRLLTEMHSGGSAQPVLTQHTYDSVGRPMCMARRMNPGAFSSQVSAASGSEAACHIGATGDYGPDRVATFEYYADGRLHYERRAVETDAAQVYSTYAYTSNGRIDSVDDANGNRSKFQYDVFDRTYRLYFPQPTVGVHSHNTADFEEYGYDKNGNRTTVKLRSGETISHMFDALNREITKTVPGTAGWEAHYGYTLQGLNTFARFGSISGYGVKNEYDGFGRQISNESIAASGSLKLTYINDEDGNRTRVTWPSGSGLYVDYTYDGKDRMDQVRENGATSGPGLLADYDEDAISRRSYLHRGNTTTTHYQYDGISRLSNLDQTLASTGKSLSLVFGYNPASQLIQRDVSNDVYAYFAQTLAQSRDYQPDGLNRYSAVGGVAYNYDGRGNLLTLADGSRSYTYDLENHLLSASGSAATAVNLTYDPMGRLLTSTSGGTTTRYLYDGDRLVAEYNGSTIMRRYVHGAGVDEPLVWYEGAGLSDRRWLHTDHQGSVVATSDGAGAGTVYAYSVYGEPAYDNWSGSRFRYTGQIMLPEAKLYHYKGRVYDPALGRFLQTDPVGYADDFNLYAYVRNDPMSHNDPTGLRCEGSGDDSKCTIDFANTGTEKDPNWVNRADAIKSGNFTEKQLSQLEKSITKAYVAAQKLGDNTITVAGQAAGLKDQQVSGSRIAMVLQDQKLRVANHNSVKDGVEQLNVPASSYPTTGITFWRSGLNSPYGEAGQEHMTIHEALHSVHALNGWQTRAADDVHQAPFKDAVEQMLGPAPW